MDRELYREVFAAERKTVEVTLNGNEGGKFARIAEQTGAKRTTVIVPAVGLPKLVAVLQQAIKVDAGGLGS